MTQRAAKPVDPETAIDQSIREALDAAIESDPDLKDRHISFSVDSGDITVTGLVRTESEREKVNDLAMQVPTVKSVANALRVTPD